MKQPYSPRDLEKVKGWHLRSHSEAINWLYQKIKNLPRQRSGGDGGRNVFVPLMPTLIIGGTVESPTYKFTISNGFVNERVPGDGDAFFAVEIKDILWGDDAIEPIVEGDPKEIEISIGQQITVKVYVDQYGQLGGTLAPEDYDAELVAEDEDAESTHYEPVCGDNRDGKEGVYHYKIAVLRDVDTDHSTPWLDLYLAGSHIDHFRDLPLIDNYTTEAEDDYGRPVGKYNEILNTYQFRSSKARFGTTITEEEELFNFDFLGENIGAGSEVLKLPETEEGDPLPNESVKFRTIRGLTSSEADGEGMTAAQITVDTGDGDGSDEGADDTIVIRGNSNKAALIFETDAASPEEIGRVEWEDGLIVHPEDVRVTIPGSGGGNLNLSIKQWVENSSGFLSEQSIVSVLYWRNGLFVGNTDPADSPTELIEEIVAVIEQVA